MKFKNTLILAVLGISLSLLSISADSDKNGILALVQLHDASQSINKHDKQLVCLPDEPEITIDAQQKALENLRQISEDLKQSGQIANHLNLTQQQIQLAALENLLAITQKLSKKVSKKDSKGDKGPYYKKLLQPSYILEQTVNGTLHVAGRVYDKCETALITAATYGLVLKIFFPGTLSAVQQVFNGLWNGVQIIDSGIGAVANDPLGSIKTVWELTPASHIFNGFPTTVTTTASEYGANIASTVSEYGATIATVVSDCFSTIDLNWFTPGILSLG